MIAAAEKGLRGGRYIAAGQSLTMPELLATYEKVTGIPAPRRRLSALLMLLLALANESWSVARRKKESHMNDLNGSTVVLTGGMDGLGRYVAERLAKKSASLVIIARNEDKGRSIISRDRKRLAIHRRSRVACIHRDRSRSDRGQTPARRHPYQQRTSPSQCSRS